MIMKDLFNPYFLSLIVVVFFGYYGVFRSVKALSYINQLSIQCMFVDSEYHDEFVDNIYERYSYYDYFFSFKPLESKYWFTKEEVNKYKLELVDKAAELLKFD